ncbi:swi5-dependent recombination DNA repair protein 1 homolog [Pimephales promelas]|uniref:swi5-dependent recombination DNA repair protein 1 homolog n=1 Tax=Pimephales promelas TaxID=90988 RepID=UPI001955934D|nr:swi5-dependent recombination DNA repair protein 1 homolog [Pimephales promelas]XP_039528885.1 swi5-dependent recombination DNA repair protein 1 homolog [Pimephales promelas]KAG1927199.1 swi5-dependent recombination DNA repair protein [Pimephales promelas]KAG1927200.1 swi5-dependent recombination DNA repair protein [Pimephales promelas]
MMSIMETTPIKQTPANDTTPNTDQSSSSRSSVTTSMSASLREKLKRARHSFRSPLSVVKRLKIEDNNKPHTSQQPGDTKHSVTEERETDTDVNQNDKRAQRDCSHDHTAETAPNDSIRQYEELRKAVKERSETLRRLKMVQMYRNKNDLTRLQMLIDKWRSCAQSVLYDLQSELPTEGKQTSLSQLIDNFGLDDKLLHFDRTEEEFTDT